MESNPSELAIPPTYPYQNLVRTLHKADGMFKNNPKHYLDVGLSALSVIRRYTDFRVHPVVSILDMPCGYGRVARALRAHYPEARMTVCDLDQKGVDFCAASFSARGVYSNTDFDVLDLNEQYDLIWVGSLITHLDADTTARFCRFLVRQLSENGTAVVSSHGAYVAGRMREALKNEALLYGLKRDAMVSLLESYFVSGYGYADFPNAKGYGISLISADWLRQAISDAQGSMTEYLSHIWDRHHDIFACVRGKTHTL
jgi:cyclopropane fatty-acyl-phospholipid synthase-like methyltransferase